MLGSSAASVPLLSSTPLPQFPFDLGDRALLSHSQERPQVRVHDENRHSCRCSVWSPGERPPPPFSGLYTCQDTDSIPNVLYS